MSYMEFQINCLLYLQHFRDITGGVLNPLFSLLTACGEFLIPLSAVSLVLWCIDKKSGFFLLLNTTVSVLLNHLLKNIVCIYRPWIIDSNVHPLESAFKMAPGYSFPSGHTAIATGIWGGIARVWHKNKLVLFSMIALICLVGLSRCYLGVHTPQDVVVALIIGVFVIIFGYKVYNWVDNGKNRDLYLTLTVIVLGFLILLYTTFKGYPIDYVNGKVLVSPYAAKLGTFSKYGILFASFLGWFLERRFIKFDEKRGTVKTKIIRFLIGLVFLVPLIACTSEYFQMIFGQPIGKFLYYTAIGFYITCIYPLFIKLSKL